MLPRKILVLILLVLLGVAGYAALRANVPVTAFRREIVFNAPRQVAWGHFARVREWPRWFKSITSVEMAPGDVIEPETVATLVMGSTSSTFRMAEFDPPNEMNSLPTVQQ